MLLFKTLKGESLQEPQASKQLKIALTTFLIYSLKHHNDANRETNFRVFKGDIASTELGPKSRFSDLRHTSCPLEQLLSLPCGFSWYRIWAWHVLGDHHIFVEWRNKKAKVVFSFLFSSFYAPSRWLILAEYIRVSYPVALRKLPIPETCKNLPVFSHSFMVMRT